MHLIEEIQKNLELMPLDKQMEVLNFILFLRQQSGHQFSSHPVSSIPAEHYHFNVPPHLPELDIYVPPSCFGHNHSWNLNQGEQQ